MRKPRRTPSHGYSEYARCETCTQCVSCRALLTVPVPMHADFHKLCPDCFDALPSAPSDVEVNVTRVAGTPASLSERGPNR